MSPSFNVVQVSFGIAQTLPEPVKNQSPSFTTLPLCAFCASLLGMRQPDDSPSPESPLLRLRLYIKENTFDMRAALGQVHSFLQEQHHSNSYVLEVLDCDQHREEAIADAIPFTPCLVRVDPKPSRIIPMPATNHQALDQLLFQ